MAGLAREEEKPPKKHNSFKQRKNSFQGARREASSPPIPSPSAPVASGLTLPKTQEHVPVNNFNSLEVTNYLTQSYSTVYGAYHDPSTPEKEKPELYSSGEKAWGNKGGLKWSKGTTMANGQDFLLELRKGLDAMGGKSA